MNIRYIIYGLIGAIVIAVIAVIFFLVKGSMSNNSPANTEANVTPIYTGAYTNVIKNDPTKLVIKGFSGKTYTVNNFLKDVSSTDAVLYETNSYQVLYATDGDSFYLLLKTQPYDAARATAEEQLTKILGLSATTDLCDISVHVNLIGDYGLPPGEQVDYGLSICPNTKILPK